MKIDGLNVAAIVGAWTKHAFNFRSSYYTGRDANCGDLTSRMLEQIYDGIKADIGKDEATNFAQFVNSLTDLSASAFIQAFELFWNSDCQLTSINQRASTRNQLTGHNENEVMCEAFVLIAGRWVEVAFRHLKMNAPLLTSKAISSGTIRRKSEKTKYNE